jgi:hypothetical protein
MGQKRAVTQMNVPVVHEQKRKAKASIILEMMVLGHFKLTCSLMQSSKTQSFHQKKRHNLIDQWNLWNMGALRAATLTE